MNPAYRIVVLLLALLAAGALHAAGSTPPDAAVLEAAREALRVQEGAWQRLREEFERLLAAGRLRRSEADDYRAFLDELEARVRAERGRVAALEGATGSEAALRAHPGRSLPDGFDHGLTAGERVTALDAELGTSLSEFDEQLLREQQAVAAKARSAGSSGAAAGDAGGGAGASAGEQSGRSRDGVAEDGRERGDDAGDAGATAGAAGGEQAGGAPAEDAAGEVGADGRVAEAGEGSGGDGRAHSEHSGVPADVGSGEDDDIVARQIREAAERERDPALREKLWEEYRRYKSRGGQAVSR